MGQRPDESASCTKILQLQRSIILIAALIPVMSITLSLTRDGEAGRGRLTRAIPLYLAESAHS